MHTEITTITKPAKVGIYDGAYVARVYADKILLTVPFVRWENNSGHYDEKKLAIRDPSVVTAVNEDLRDDCEDSAWATIGRAVHDDYLSHA